MVLAVFEGEGYSNGGHTGPQWHSENKEWHVDVIAAASSPGVPQTTYWITFDASQHVPSAADAFVVQLVDEDGAVLATKRLGGGGTIGSTGDTDASSKPFPEEELYAK